jgi:hypothetical protein
MFQKVGVINQNRQWPELVLQALPLQDKVLASHPTNKQDFETSGRWQWSKGSNKTNRKISFIAFADR